MNVQETDVVPYHLTAVPACEDVWVFAPHPDDEVFGCGGLLALLVQAGRRVHVVVLTDGGAQLGAGDAPGGRMAESHQAATVLGYSGVVCWGLPDRGVRFEEPLVERMLACVLSTPGCMVLAPSLWEAHPDHRACAMAAAEAVRRAGGDRDLWLYEVSAPLRANALVDVSSVWPLKQRAMACFVSQEAVLPYADFIASLNRYRALTVLPQGHVEAFERCPSHGLAGFALESPAHGLRRLGVPAVPGDCPLVSVVVRTLNRATLGKAVASVQAQTYPRLELVVVDASGQGQLPAGVQNLGLVVNEGRRLGRAEAANAGLARAHGEWLLLLDDDDWLYPDHVAKLVAASWSQSALAFYSDVVCVDASGEPTGVVFEQPYAPDELKYGNFLPIHAVLFNRRAWEQGARFDPAFDLYEDWDFWLQVERLGRLERVPGVSAAYVIAGGSGAGVAVDQAQAKAATQAIRAKWQLALNGVVFDELVRRSLERRQLLGQLARVRADLALTHAQLGAEQQAARASQAEADRDRRDAHALRVAHDRACADRDAFKQSMNDLVRLTVSHHEREIAVAKALALLEASHTQLTGELQATHARLYQAELRAEQAQARFTQVVASRSWAVTKPLRLLTWLWQAGRRLGWSRALSRGVEVVRSGGVAVVMQKAEGAGQPAPTGAVPAPGRAYADWVAQYDALDEAQLAVMAGEAEALLIRPKVSVVMPVYNTLAGDLQAAIDSVKAQIYGEWELCICDDASTQAHVADILARASASDDRIKVVRRQENGHISAATNSALALCTGDYVAFLDHDDVLAPHALLRVVMWLQAHPGTRLMYSDEDKIGLDGQRFDPYFKPDFNLGLLRSHNYMCHFAVYERQLIEALGGPRVGFEGAQDYDLVLRAVDRLDATEIGHIPHLLYHWRVTPGSTAGGHQEKSYAFLAGQKALQAHLERRGLAGDVCEAPEAPGMYRVRWAELTSGSAPKVSVVIPTRNGVHLLRTCLDTLRLTDYPNFEVLVIDNGSDDPEALALMAEREAAGDIRVLRDDSPFNFSALNNRAVRQGTDGEFVVLMNNDIEITHASWLQEMVGVALEPGVGCVGARLWYPDGRLQHGGVIMVCGVAGHAHKYLPKGHHGYMGRAVLMQDFLAVTAACLLVRRSVFDEVGGLDETLQVAFNDVDFCLKVHAAGYRNVWTPFAEMVHHESVSRGHEDTPEKQRRFAGEIAILQQRWPGLLAHDPCYSPNLTDQAEDFSLAWPPRRTFP